MSRARSTATYHHGDLHETAVAAALDALDRDGVLPSLRSLADRCGVSHTALYRHFDGRDALALAVGARCYTDLASALRKAVAGADSAEERLRASGRAYVRWGLDHPGRYRFMTGAALAGHRDAAAFVAAAAAAFGVLVDAVAALGVPDPVAVAHTIFAATHGLVDLAVNGRSIPGRAASMAAQTNQLLDAMAGHARARARTRRGR